MNKHWPQQEAFCKRVRQYCQQQGFTKAQGGIDFDIASDMFDMSGETLRQCIQNKSRKRPRYDRLAYIAGVIGCSVTEFLDSPGDPPLPLPQEKWAELTERERVLASELNADITSPDLTLAEKELLYGVFQDMKERLIQQRQ